MTSQHERTNLVRASEVLLVLVLDVQTLFRGGFQLLAIELLQLLHGVLVDGVDHVKHLRYGRVQI